MGLDRQLHHTDSGVDRALHDMIKRCHLQAKRQLICSVQRMILSLKTRDQCLWSIIQFKWNNAHDPVLMKHCKQSSVDRTMYMIQCLENSVYGAVCIIQYLWTTAYNPLCMENCA